MNQEEIEAALLSGDPELMQQAIDASEKLDVPPEEPPVEDPKPVVVEEEKPEVVEPPVEEPVSSDGEGVEKVLLSKSGKEEIPYSVLEQERSARKREQEEVERLRRENAELQAKHQENETALANVTARLEKKGMDAQSMLADPDAITDEERAEIVEDYGKMGETFLKMLDQQKLIVNQTAATPAPAAQEATTLTPTQQAIANNAELMSWQKSDPDRWAQAAYFDDQLKADPAWQNKSLDERFAEAVRLTNESFGQRPSSEEKAQQIIDKTKQPAPDSLTDVGQAPAATKTDAEAMTNMSAEELEAHLAQMPGKTVSDILAQGF